MKASMSPRASYFAAIFCIAATVCAQDSITQKDNQRREGQILGVSNGSIKFKVGPVQTGVPLDQVASVTMAAPKAYADALATWKSGDAQKTLTILKPFVENYRGLPTQWARRASALLGDVYLALNQIPAAETAFADFQKAYPEATSIADIGLATLAVNQKDYATARAKLTPVIAESEKTVLAETGKSAAYGQAHYLMGLILEAEGSYPEALKHYLSTVTLFYEDQAVADKAQDRADFLVKEKQTIVP